MDLITNSKIIFLGGFKEMEKYEKPIVIEKVYSYYGLVDAGCCFRSCGGAPVVSFRPIETRDDNLIEEKLQFFLNKNKNK